MDQSIGHQRYAFLSFAWYKWLPTSKFLNGARQDVGSRINTISWFIDWLMAFNTPTLLMNLWLDFLLLTDLKGILSPKPNPWNKYPSTAVRRHNNTWDTWRVHKLLCFYPALTSEKFERSGLLAVDGSVGLIFGSGAPGIYEWRHAMFSFCMFFCISFWRKNLNLFTKVLKFRAIMIYSMQKMDCKTCDVTIFEGGGRSNETEIKVHGRLKRWVLPRLLTPQTWKRG